MGWDGMGWDGMGWVPSNHERSNYIFRLLLKNVLEPKRQPIEAAPGAVLKKEKICLKTSNFVDFSKKLIFVPTMNDLILE